MRGELLRLTLVQPAFDRSGNLPRVHSSDDLRGHPQDHVAAQ